MSESYDEPTTTKGNNKSYTANPRAPRGEDYDESTGPVTSDSLANESIQQGGGFSENANPDVYSVKGANSTFTNTNTSSARKLHAADDREDRDGDRFSSTAYPSALSGGQGGDYDGTTSDQGYRGGSGQRGASSYNNNDTDNAYSNTDDSYENTGRSNTTAAASGAYDNDDNAFSTSRTAPSYTDTSAGYNRDEGELKPKGSNLIEDDDAIPPNRKTYTGDVGGPKDPGRLAEAKFQQSSARSGADAGYARDMGDVDDGSKYDSLNSSERA